MADNKDTTINCPACGKPMKKIYMPKQGINLDVCVDGCGGIYFDNRELSRFDEPHEDISPLEEIFEGKEFQKVDENITRVCPVCGSDMVKNYTGANKETVIDECYHCGGKFLDYGELTAMRAEYNTENERSGDVIKKLYQEVGSEILERPNIAKNINQNNGKNVGLIIGLAVSVLWLISKKEIISPALNSQNYNDPAFSMTVVIAIAILCLFTGIGAVIGRLK